MPDPDQPPRRPRTPATGGDRRAPRSGTGDPASSAPGGSVAAGPAGEGWDDGRGNRTGGARPARGRRPGGAASRGRRGGLPRWAIPAAVAAVVLLVVVLVLTLGGGDGRRDAGPCLTELSAHLPESATVAYGSDLVQARSVGYDDDGDLEALGATQRETGVLPDALSNRFRYRQLISAEAFTARTGVEPGDIECSLTAADRSIMSGEFDQVEVAGSVVAEDGDLAATDDRLALTTGDADPEQLLQPRDGGGLGSNDDVVAVIEALREDDSYSVLVEAGNPRAEARARAAGIGVAEGEGDEGTLVIAWAFADEDAATAGQADVVEAVNDAFEGTTSISAGDLRVDGSLVRGRITTREAPDLLPLVGRQLRLIPADT